MLAVDVRLHELLVSEGCVAHRAAVAALAVVLEAMQLEHVVIAEIPQTDVAGVGPLASVSARVHLELLGAREALPAARRGTAVRLLARVGPQMDHQLARLDEGLVAVRTSVRPLARVYARVTVQLARVLEGGPADLAGVRSLLGVYAAVHLQVFLDAEHLVAELTLEGPLSRVRAVVARQPRRHQERLVAHVTAVPVAGRAVRARVSCERAASGQHQAALRAAVVGLLLFSCGRILFEVSSSSRVHGESQSGRGRSVDGGTLQL